MLDIIIKHLKKLNVTESTKEDITALESLILNHKDKDSLSRDEKDEIVYNISQFIISGKSTESFLRKIDQLIHSNQVDNEVRELLIHCLIESSENEVSSSILKIILGENNFKLKLHYLKVSKQTRWKRIQKRNMEKGATFQFEVIKKNFNFMETWFEEPAKEEMWNGITVLK